MSHDVIIPESYKETLDSEDSRHWKRNMVEELESMAEHQVWKLYPGRKTRRQ